MNAWDVAVIGSGIVGLACARELGRRGLRVVVIEREAVRGRGTSSRNSGVLHAGMYYPTGSLKASLCVRGRDELEAYCASRGVPHALVGKLIVATDTLGESKLEALLAQGRANGVRALERISVAAATKAEPNVRCRAALRSPKTGIVDVHAVMDALASDAREADVDFAFRHRLVGVGGQARAHDLVLVDPSGESITVTVPRVVNAAGLYADEVAALAGADLAAHDLAQRWVKGSWFRVRGRPVSRLVYPVPEANLAGLGVHATVDLDGAVKLGPDVEPLTARREDYTVDEQRADAFFRAASAWLPALGRQDLAPDQSGIRPKLSWPDQPARDFVVLDGRERGRVGWVDLLGIESPGLTCALPLATSVASLLEP